MFHVFAVLAQGLPRGKFIQIQLITLPRGKLYFIFRTSDDKVELFHIPRNFFKSSSLYKEGAKARPIWRDETGILLSFRAYMTTRTRPLCREELFPTPRVYYRGKSSEFFQFPK